MDCLRIYVRSILRFCFPSHDFLMIATGMNTVVSLGVSWSAHVGSVNVLCWSYIYLNVIRTLTIGLSSLDSLFFVQSSLDSIYKINTHIELDWLHLGLKLLSEIRI